MTIGIGMIGGGYWGEKLLRVFSARADAEVRVLADRDPARRAELGGSFRLATEAREVWDDPAVDAVVVATPPSSHFELALSALRAAKHCWVEKPLAMQPAEAATLVAAAAQARRTLFVDETFLYDPLIRRARQWIEAGRLGEICHLSFERLSMGRIRRDSDIWWNAAPHDVALLRYLLPLEVEGVSRQSHSFVQPGIADVAFASLSLQGGVSAHIHVSWLSPVKRGSITVIGRRGMLVFEGRFGQRELTFYDYAVGEAPTTANVLPIDRFTASETVRGGNEEPLALAAEAFIDSIRTGHPAPSDGRYSQKVVEILARVARV